MKTLSGIGGSILLNDCHSYNADRAGNAVHKTFPQLSEARQIHAHRMASGYEFQLFEGNCVMDMYVKGGSMVEARHVFDNMPKRNVVSWNMMILGYAKQEECGLALELYIRMLQEGVQQSDRTFVGALRATSGLAGLEVGKQVHGKFMKIGSLEIGRAIHSQVVNNCFESNVFVGNTLVDMYVNCASMEDARHVFDDLPQRDVVTWNTMISGHAEKEEGMLALELYSWMHQQGIQPNERTFLGVLKACGSLAALEEGKQVGGKFVKSGCLEKSRAIHCQVMKSGFQSNVFVGTTLVDIYAKSGSIEDARHVFDELPERNVVSWNAMILGHAQKEEGTLALELYACMQQEGIQPSYRTFVAALTACSSLAALEEGTVVNGKTVKKGCLEKGRTIHYQVLKSGFESDIFVGSTLVDAYAKCGSVEDGRHVFEQLSHRNAVSWNTMISGYAGQEESQEAFKLYVQMQEQGVSADGFTFVSILKACGNTAALEIGKELHAQISRAGLETAIIVANTIIDMYGKCGSMGDAQQLFDTLPSRDFVTWNALIAGYARQGESELVFHLVDRMREEGIQANGVTFLSVLTVCSHAGLVDKGQKYFQAMSKQYNIVPTIEHYTCMIDLLGRAGQVEKAVAIVDNMPFQADVVSWFAVLGACQEWNNAAVGRNAFECVVRLDEKNTAAYVLMSNIYAHTQVWEDHNEIHLMKEFLSMQEARTELLD